MTMLAIDRSHAPKRAEGSRYNANLTTSLPNRLDSLARDRLGVTVAATCNNLSRPAQYIYPRVRWH